MRPREAFESLVEAVAFETVLGMSRCGRKTAVQRVRDGETIPEYLLPGRFILWRSQELRDALPGVTSEMANVRDDVAASWLEVAQDPHQNTEHAQKLKRQMNRIDRLVERRRQKELL